jgi:hypothetical protein
MTLLDEEYKNETGENALYKIGMSDYHTLKYVKWLEAIIMKARVDRTKFCSPAFHKACHLADLVVCPHCKIKV